MLGRGWSEGGSDLFSLISPLGINRGGSITILTLNSANLRWLSLSFRNQGGTINA